MASTIKLDYFSSVLFWLLYYWSHLDILLYLQAAVRPSVRVLSMKLLSLYHIAEPTSALDSRQKKSNYVHNNERLKQVTDSPLCKELLQP